MLPSAIKRCLCYLVILCIVSVTSGQDRKIKPERNPGCISCGSNTVLIHIAAEGASDTVHQIWDFTRGEPTLIFMVGSVNSTLKILWDDDKPTHFNLSEKIKYSFAITLDKLYEYNDLKDNGEMDDKCPRKEFPLDHLRWQLNSSTLTDKEVMVALQSNNFRRDGDRNGLVLVKLDLLPYTDYAADLPHLIHTANSTLVDVSLVNLTTSRHYNASRYSWHATIVATEHNNDSMHMTIRKSLDDEHTPGVFEIFELKTPASYTGDDGGFVMFRPVAYTQQKRGVSASTVAHVSNFNRTDYRAGSTLDYMYRQFPKNMLLKQDFVVSFGESGDGYYKLHNYTAWSFSVGYGIPPTEGLSLFVVLVISIGLGVPVLLVFSGAAYLMTKRLRAGSNPPRRLID